MSAERYYWPKHRQSGRGLVGPSRLRKVYNNVLSGHELITPHESVVTHEEIGILHCVMNNDALTNANHPLMLEMLSNVPNPISEDGKLPCLNPNQNYRWVLIPNKAEYLRQSLGVNADDEVHILAKQK